MGRTLLFVCKFVCLCVREHVFAVVLVFAIVYVFAFVFEFECVPAFVSVFPRCVFRTRVGLCT